MVAVELTICPQLGVFGPKKSDIINDLTFQPGKTTPYLNIFTLHVCTKIILVKE